MHVVVVCPRCKGANAVREDQKSATCPRCGRSYDPRRSRVYHRSSSPAEVARVVGEMNARLEGGFKRYSADRGIAEAPRESPEGMEGIASRVGMARGRQRQLEEAVTLLSSRPAGEFTSDELTQVLKAAGWPVEAVEEALSRLRESGEVVERRPDRFRPA